MAVGNDGRLELEVRDSSGGPSTWAAISAAPRTSPASRRAAERRCTCIPLGQPEVGRDGTRLRFHTEFEEAGDYRLFVQVRVDGFLHTVPVTVTVHPGARGS